MASVYPQTWRDGEVRFAELQPPRRKSCTGTCNIGGGGRGVIKHGTTTNAKGMLHRGGYGSNTGRPKRATRAALFVVPSTSSPLSYSCGTTNADHRRCSRPRALRTPHAYTGNVYPTGPFLFRKTTKNVVIDAHRYLPQISPIGNVQPP